MTGNETPQQSRNKQIRTHKHGSHQVSKRATEQQYWLKDPSQNRDRWDRRVSISANCVVRAASPTSTIQIQDWKLQTSSKRLDIRNTLERIGWWVSMKLDLKIPQPPPQNASIDIWKRWRENPKTIPSLFLAGKWRENPLKCQELDDDCPRNWRWRILPNSVTEFSDDPKINLLTLVTEERGSSNSPLPSSYPSPSPHNSGNRKLK